MPIQQMPQQRVYENPEYENRISDIYVKLDELESHLAIRVKQQKLERISRSRSKSQTKVSGDFEAMEKRLQGQMTNKLAKTVEQIGSIIKKQELRLIKLHKSFKEFKAKNTVVKGELQRKEEPTRP